MLWQNQSLHPGWTGAFTSYCRIYTCNVCGLFASALGATTLSSILLSDYVTQWAFLNTGYTIDVCSCDPCRQQRLCQCLLNRTANCVNLNKTLGLVHNVYNVLYAGLVSDARTARDLVLKTMKASVYSNMSRQFNSKQLLNALGIIPDQ